MAGDEGSEDDDRTNKRNRGSRQEGRERKRRRSQESDEEEEDLQHPHRNHNPAVPSTRAARSSDETSPSQRQQKSNSSRRSKKSDTESIAGPSRRAVLVDRTKPKNLPGSAEHDACTCSRQRSHAPVCTTCGAHGTAEPAQRQRRKSKFRPQREDSSRSRKVEDGLRPNPSTGLDKGHASCQSWHENQSEKPAKGEDYEQKSTVKNEDENDGSLSDGEEAAYHTALSDGENGDQESPDGIDTPDGSDGRKATYNTNSPGTPSRYSTSNAIRPYRTSRYKDPNVHQRDLKLARAYGTANGRLACHAVIQTRLVRALTQIRQPSSRDQYEDAYDCAVQGLDLAKVALETDPGQEDAYTLRRIVAQAHYYAGLAAYLAGPDGFARALEHLESSLAYADETNVMGRTRAEEVINHIIRYQRDPNLLYSEAPPQDKQPSPSRWTWLRETIGSFASSVWSSPYSKGAATQKGQRLNSDMFDGEVSPGRTASVRSASARGGATRSNTSATGLPPSGYRPPEEVGLGISLWPDSGLYGDGAQTGSFDSNEGFVPMATTTAKKRMSISTGSTRSSETFGRDRPAPQRMKTAPSSLGSSRSSSAKIGAVRSASSRSDEPLSASRPGSSSRFIASTSRTHKQLNTGVRPARLPDTIVEEREDTFVGGLFGQRTVKKISDERFIEEHEPPGEGSRLPRSHGPDFHWPNVPYEGYVPPDEGHSNYQGPWLIGYHDGKKWVEIEAEGEPIWRYYTDVKIKRLIEKGPGQKDEHGNFIDDGLKWNEEIPWTVYHPLQRSPKAGDELPLTEEPEDYPQGFYEAGFRNARYAEPYAKRDWQMNDFVLPVKGMGIGPDYVGGDGTEDEIVNEAARWQQKQRMARRVVGPKVHQIVKEFARGTMHFMLETLTLEEMFEYCLDVNHAALGSKVWELLCERQARKQRQDDAPLAAAAPGLTTTQPTVFKRSPVSSQVLPTPRLAKATPAVINGSPVSLHGSLKARSPRTELKVVNISPQDFEPYVMIAPALSPVNSQHSGIAVSPLESVQTSSASRSPKAELAVVYEPGKEPSTPPQLPKMPETPPAPRKPASESEAQDGCPTWSPTTPEGVEANSVFSSPEAAALDPAKMIEWTLPPWPDKYDRKRKAASPLANRTPNGDPVKRLQPAFSPDKDNGKTATVNLFSQQTPSPSRLPATPRLRKAELATTDHYTTSSQASISVVPGSVAESGPEKTGFSATIVSPRETVHDPEASRAKSKQPLTVRDPSWSQASTPIIANTLPALKLSPSKSPGQSSSVTWRTPIKNNDLQYRGNHPPISPLGHDKLNGSPSSWSTNSSPSKRSGSSPTAYSSSISSTSDNNTQHRRRSSLIQTTLGLLTGSSGQTMSAEDAAERGESPVQSPVVEKPKKKASQNRLSLRVGKQPKILEELLEEGYSPGLAPEGFGEDGRTFTM